MLVIEWRRLILLDTADSSDVAWGCASHASPLAGIASPGEGLIPNPTLADNMADEGERYEGPIVTSSDFLESLAGAERFAAGCCVHAIRELYLVLAEGRSDLADHQCPNHTVCGHAVCQVIVALRWAHERMGQQASRKWAEANPNLASVLDDALGEGP